MRNTHANVVERLIAFLMGRRIVTCNRCGWRGRTRGEVAKTSHGRKPSSKAELAQVLEIDLGALDRRLDKIESPRLNLVKP